MGEKGTATLTGAELRVHFREGHELVAGAEEEVAGGADPMAFPHDFHCRLIADFIDALEEGRAPRVTGLRALQVHRFIDALLTSAADRRIVAPDT